MSDEHLTRRPQQILEAARRLFAERGFSRTTMAEVVDASGLSTGSVYRYFPSKSDLVLAAVADRDGIVDGELPVESSGELLVRLAGYVTPGGGENHARLIAQIWGDAAVVPELAGVVGSSHTRLEEHLARLLTAERGYDYEDQAQRVAQVTLAALIGLAALVATGIPVDGVRFAETVIELSGRASQSQRGEAGSEP